MTSERAEDAPGQGRGGERGRRLGGERSGREQGGECGAGRAGGLRAAVRLVHEVPGLLGNLDGEERHLVGGGNVAGAVVADEVVLYPLPLEREAGEGEA